MLPTIYYRVSTRVPIINITIVFYVKVMLEPIDMATNKTC